MSHKRLSAITSFILTILSLLLVGLGFFFFEIIALNGFSGREGEIALSTMAICHSTGMILSAIFASWLTGFVITKFDLNKIFAVVVAVFAGTLLGGMISFLATFFSLAVVAVR